MNDDARTELGFRIAAAVLSYQMGIQSMDYFRKHYLGSDDIGESWKQAGDLLVQMLSRPSTDPSQDHAVN